jgi:hypothetical protein
MPALLFTAALAAGQPPSEAARWIDPAASAQARLVQDLSAVVSGTAPFPTTGPRPAAGVNTGPVSLRLAGAGLSATSADTGASSATQSATTVSARVSLPSLAASPIIP